MHAVLRREVVGGLSLLYTWPGRDPSRKPILLSAHLDVVPVETETARQWSHPPFSGAVADGHVWGRGTIDDKGAALGVLEAVEVLAARGFFSPRARSTSPSATTRSAAVPRAPRPSPPSSPPGASASNTCSTRVCWSATG